MRNLFLLFFAFIFCFICEAKVPSIHEMTLEEKVGQLFMVFFIGQEVNDDAKTVIQQAHVGSIIYYQWANGLTSPQQVQKLSNDLQRMAQNQSHGIPLFIAADQEGGVVARLNQGFTQFPGNSAIGQSGHPELAEESTFAIGQEMKAVGINMNLAPVVDVNSNPQKPVIGVRSFSSKPNEVAHLGFLALKGYKRAGVIATLKHFPGYGEVSVDPHYDLPVVSKSKEEIHQTELFPFRALIPHAPAIMTAHIIMPALDSQHCATLSKVITNDLLRKEMNFDGLILTDSLVMQGLLNECENIDEATVQAILAGNDIVTFGGKMLGQKDAKDLTPADILRIFQHTVDAVKNGRISQERLDASVVRILKLKQSAGLFDQKYPDASDISQNVKTYEHQQLAKKIATHSVKILHNELQLPLNLTQGMIVAPSVLREPLENVTLPKMEMQFYEGLAPNESEINLTYKKAQEADVVIVFSYNAWKNEAQQKLISGLLKTGKPVIIVAVRDPHDVNLFAEADAIIATYSPTACSLQAAIDLLHQDPSGPSH
jgi:beta-N-acetylhexosaminidase